MGLPHLRDSKLMGLHDDHKPRVDKILPPPKVAYKPTETMRVGSADGTGWSHPERTRSWSDGLRAKDRGGPIECDTLLLSPPPPPLHVPASTPDFRTTSVVPTS
jgi:hypothetical protein